MGETVEEAKVESREDLQMFLEAQEENGTALPDPRSREEVLAAEEL